MKTAASLSDKIRDAIRSDGRSISELSRLAGLQQPTLDVIHRLADVAGRRLSLGRGRRATNNSEGTK